MATRTTKDASQLRQEKWCSSPALERGMKANLVARRCSVLKGTEYRCLIWSLQFLSHQAGQLERITKASGITEAEIAALCLDPAVDPEPFHAPLSRCIDAYIQERADGVVTTEIGDMIWEGFEYCLHSRSMVLISGPARIGKTFTAERFCEQFPGMARYCQVPSPADDLAFFCAIARSLGITIESNAKTKNVRPRIEAALQGGDLMLVLDCAEFCWPSHSYRLARPARICWLMTALANHQVPVCLIATQDFFNAQRAYEKKSGWQSAQWTGRIGRFVQLPDKLGLPDLERVARSWMPYGETKIIQCLADYANLSTKHLAAIEHIVNHARFFARKRGVAFPTWEDVQKAICEGAIPSDTGLAAALKGSAESDPISVLAKLARGRRATGAAKN
jgi:hypothetical protein